MRTNIQGAVALALAAFAATCAAQPSEAEARAARYLAANCANCHGTTGTARGGMPSLAGQQKAFIIEQMKAFRDGKRPATIMHQLSKGYTDQQIEVIAEYFAQQKPAR